VLVITWLIPQLQKFPDNKAGILISRIGGHELTDHFGSRNFNHVLEEELYKRLIKFQSDIGFSGLDTIIVFKSISWQVSAEDQARQFMEKYDAIGIIRGNIIKIDDAASLECWLRSAPIVFSIKLPNQPELGVRIDRVLNPPFKLNFSDSTYNMDCYVKQIFNNLLPAIISALRYNYETISLELIELAPNIDEAFLDLDYLPFFLQTLASGHENLGQHKKALEYYDLSWKYFMIYLHKRRSGDVKIKMDVMTIRQFAAYSRAKEAKLALSTGDIERALNCYTSAYLAIDAVSRETIKFYIENLVNTYKINIDIDTLDFRKLHEYSNLPFEY
jgi:hypothetical protein